MKTSVMGEMFIERMEGGLVPVAYQDSGGIWTVGCGHTSGVGPGTKCTESQAAQWLEQDLMTVDSCLARNVKTDLKQWEWDALSSFVFNIGCTHFSSSTLLRDLNAGDKQAAADQLPLWDHAAGKVVRGLDNRRHMERTLFLTGDYANTYP
jgi:lysozyme